MLQTAVGFLGGYAARSSCASLPCQARLSAPGRTFKLGVVVHSATLSDVEGGGMIENQRPLIGVSVADRAKETELGDWSRDKGQWCFREVITISVSTGDDMCVYVSSSTRYNFGLAALSLGTTRRIGSIQLPVSLLLMRLQPEDRDCDGIVYATQVMPFDIITDGRHAGRIYLSFETNSAPPSQKFLDADKCCWPEACELPPHCQEASPPEGEGPAPLQSGHGSFHRPGSTFSRGSRPGSQF